jgi:hypothetical protein
VRASDGTLLDGASGFRVGTSTSATTPTLAFDGSNYLVAYQRSISALAGVRLRGSDRSALDTTDLTLVQGPTTEKLSAPRLIHDGTNFFVTWQKEFPSFSYHMMGARIRSDTGALLGGAQTLVDGALSEVALVAGSGRTFAAFGMAGGKYVLGSLALNTRAVLIDPATGVAAQPPFLLSRSGHLVGRQAAPGGLARVER